MFTLIDPGSRRGDDMLLHCIMLVLQVKPLHVVGDKTVYELAMFLSTHRVRAYLIRLASSVFDRRTAGKAMAFAQSYLALTVAAREHRPEDHSVLWDEVATEACHRLLHRMTEKDRSIEAILCTTTRSTTVERAIMLRIKKV